MRAAFLTFALVSISFVSPSAKAAEVKVFSLPGMTAALTELGPKFENTSGHKLVFTYDVNIPLMRRIDVGEKFDVIITTPEDLRNLIDRGKVIPDSLANLGRVGIAVWIRSGAAKPDIGTVDAFKQMLREAKSISYTKESATGIYLAQLMERLGIADEVRPKTTLMGGGGKNPRAVAAGEIQYGLSIATDGVGFAGVEMLGLLPNEIQNWLLFRGGIAVEAGDQTAARAFLTYLTSPENAAALKAKGWEPSEPQ
jgi:molybdate transport system substrate-binding protein